MFIVIMYVICMSCQHMLNTFPFIQRTEQVLIELDISAIEEYVIIIIIIIKVQFIQFNCYFSSILWDVLIWQQVDT